MNSKELNKKELYERIRDEIESTGRFRVSVSEVERDVGIERSITVFFAASGTFAAWLLVDDDNDVAYNLQIAGDISIFDAKELVDAIYKAYTNEDDAD